MESTISKRANQAPDIVQVTADALSDLTRLISGQVVDDLSNDFGVNRLRGLDLGDRDHSSASPRDRFNDSAGLGLGWLAKAELP
jgi:hypothetical protein